MIKVTCECGATLNVKDDYAGKRGKCPRCGKAVQIPLLDPIESEESLDPFHDSFASAFAPQSNTLPRSDSINTSAHNPPTPPPRAKAQSNPLELSRQLANDPAAYFAPVKKPPQFEVVNNCVVGKSPMTLPRYCIKCCEPITPNEIETIKVIYTPPSAAIKSIVGGSGVVMAISRKTCTVYAGLCASHRRRRVLNRVIFVLMLLIGFAFSISPFFLYPNAKGSEGVPIGITGVVIMVAAFFFLVLTNQLLSARNYDGDHSVANYGKNPEGTFTIKGFCQEFLAKLET